MTTNLTESKAKTGKQVRALIRTSKPVFGWVNTSVNDGCYIQLVKSSALLCFGSDEAVYQVEEREDGIYVN